MGVLMPIAGRIYDRIGPRWPAVIGLGIVAVATYLLRTLTIDTPRGQVMQLLAVLGLGLGLAMMPIMTGGIAVIPVAQSSVASAFNNVVRNVAAALGLAGLTAILTIQQAQQLAGRAALLPATIPTPHLGPPGTPDWLGTWAVYHQTQLQVFVAAIDDLFLISSALAALGAVTALLLRSRSSTTTTASPTQPPATTHQRLPMARPHHRSAQAGSLSPADLDQRGDHRAIGPIPRRAP